MFLSSIYQHGLDTGRCPIAADKRGNIRVWADNVVWLTTEDWRTKDIYPDDDIICIRVDIPDDDKRLERWTQVGREHVPAEHFHTDPDVRVYIHWGTIAPDKFVDVHDLTGKKFTSDMVDWEPIIRGDGAR
jgi:hypothetical protein